MARATLYGAVAQAAVLSPPPPTVATLYGTVAQVAVHVLPPYSAALSGAVAQVAVLASPSYSAALSGAVGQVAVIPPPPVAVLPDISGAPTVLATFDGSGSQYAHYYAWAWTSVPGGSAIANPTGVATATFAFTPDIAGTYTVQLTVADGVSVTADAVISAASSKLRELAGLSLHRSFSPLGPTFAGYKIK